MPLENKWSVWREDDNGNWFEMRTSLTKHFADALALEFTNRGHKQTYYVFKKGEEPSHIKKRMDNGIK